MLLTNDEVVQVRVLYLCAAAFGVLAWMLHTTPLPRSKAPR
jgi:hypothetical protein